MACTKGHGLLGIDVLKIDTLKLVNFMKLEEQEIGLLKGYKASIRFKRTTILDISKQDNYPYTFYLLLCQS